MKRFPFLEICIGLAAIILICLLGFPQYKSIKIKNKRYVVRTNMYTVRAAVENFAAYHEGLFPAGIKEIEPFLEDSLYPLNPYTNKPIKCDAVFTYEEKDKMPSLKGKPGNFAYGCYIAPGREGPDGYVVIGFDEKGEPLCEQSPSGEITLIILRNSE